MSIQIRMIVFLITIFGGLSAGELGWCGPDGSSDEHPSSFYKSNNIVPKMTYERSYSDGSQEKGNEVGEITRYRRVYVDSRVEIGVIKNSIRAYHIKSSSDGRLIEQGQVGINGKMIFKTIFTYQGNQITYVKNYEDQSQERGLIDLNGKRIYERTYVDQALETGTESSTGQRHFTRRYPDGGFEEGSAKSNGWVFYRHYNKRLEELRQQVDFQASDDFSELEDEEFTVLLKQKALINQTHF